MMQKNLVLFCLISVFAISFAFAAQTGSDIGSIDVSEGSSGNTNIYVGPGMDNPYGNVTYCGDGIRNINEQCDGSDLAGSTCTSVLGAGYTGSLACFSQCNFNTASCTAPVAEVAPTGGNGGGGGSGGGSAGSCAENWVCSEWNTCTNGVQSRTCTDSKKCGTVKIKPVLKRDCTVEGADGEAGVGADNDDNNNGFSSLFTGAFLGSTAGKWSLGVLIFLILVGLAWWIVAWKKRNGEDKPVKVVKLSQMKKK